jgi:hypothetical protein
MVIKTNATSIDSFQSMLVFFRVSEFEFYFFLLLHNLPSRFARYRSQRIYLCSQDS